MKASEESIDSSFRISENGGNNSSETCIGSYHITIHHISKDILYFYLLFVVPPVLLQTLSTLRSLINWLVGDGSSDSSPIRLSHNRLGMAPHFYEVSR